MIVVTGGDSREISGGFSAEVLKADGTQLCLLPPIQTYRRYHSMSGNILCGGFEGEINSLKSCDKFQNGTWKTLPFSLQEQRSGHVSWTRSDGKSRLLGGSHSPSTSELVSEAGSITGFPLKYKIR